VALRGVKIPFVVSMNNIHSEFTTDLNNQNFNFLTASGLNRVWTANAAGDNSPTTLSSTNIQFSSFQNKMRTPALWLLTNSYFLKNTSLIYNGADAVTYPEGGQLPPTWAAGDFIIAFNTYGYDVANPLGDSVGVLGGIQTEESAIANASGIITNFDGTYSCNIRSFICNFSKSPLQLLVRFARVGTHPLSAFNTYALVWNGNDGSKSFTATSLNSTATLLGTITETSGTDYTRVWRYEIPFSLTDPSSSVRYAAGISINFN
jgi:hypothetical protein